MKYDLTQLISQKVNEVIIQDNLVLPENDELSSNDTFQVAPVMVTGVIKRSGKQFLLDLKYESSWTYLCGRCLDETKYQLEGEIKRSIVKDSNDGDDDIVFVESTVIDLYDVIYNDIVLNLPSQVICSEDCKGLCPECGVNMNLETCTCEDDKVDPRLAKLKNLFTD